MSIIINNLTKIFGTQKAVDNISLNIPTGEVVAFLGPNGAGKSTTMKILCGYIPPTHGEALVNGINVMQNPIAVKRTIGYLPELNPLYTDMYVREYLRFVGGLYRIKNLKQRVEEMVERTGLTRESNKRIRTLSKGYKQRVGLAAAMIHNPDVLILDEPTSGLDPNQIVEIRNLIADVGREKTVMLSTHIMQEVEAICKRVVIINNGKIVAHDTTQAIQQNTAQQVNIVTVEFNAPVEQQQLVRIVGVTDALHLGNNIWDIQSANDTDVREALFQFAVEQKVSVLSMQRRQQSLEQVFRQLTTPQK